MITDANISCRSLQEAKQLFAELDKDKSGSIDLDEFLNLLRVSSTLNFLWSILVFRTHSPIVLAISLEIPIADFSLQTLNRNGSTDDQFWENIQSTALKIPYLYLNNIHPTATFARCCESSIFYLYKSFEFFLIILFIYCVCLHGYLPIDSSYIFHYQAPLSAECLDVVEKAFTKLDKTGDGVITSDDLRK